MLKTLQLYITRELVKTFALTAVGLTLVFSLCGGVLNMIQADMLSALQVARIFAFVLPLALTLTLPVAALFACAMVYGRLASDNEIDACRASGVNIHRLLGPAVALSLFTAGFTFLFANYILPTFVWRLEAIVKKDAEQIVLGSLQSRGFIRQGPYVLYAHDATLYGEDQNRKVVQIEKGAFLELEGENLRGAGTAEQARIDFLKSPDSPDVSVQATLFEVRRLDLKRNQFHEEAQQAIRGVKIPKLFKEKCKFLTLSQLARYRADLSLAPRIREHADNIRDFVREAGFYRWVVDQLSGGKSLLLQDAQHHYTVRAGQAVLNPEDMRPDLTDVHVTEVVGSQRREYTATRGSIKFKSGDAYAPDLAAVVLRDKVRFTDARNPTTVIDQKERDLDPVPVPSAATVPAASITTDQILDLPADPAKRADLHTYYKVDPKPLGLGQRIEDARIRTRRDMVDLGLEITGIIHSRLAFSASVLATLLLAAALGVIYRGGQLMTAFAIAFVPGLLVVVMNLAGRQLTEKYPTHTVGIIVIWAGIGLVALADMVVVSRYLKR